MKGEIISVGTELLLGQILNTNARFLCEELALLGISVYHTTAIGDNACRLKELLEVAWQRSDLIIMTGGLGPTLDDISKETVADFLHLNLELNERALTELENSFARRGHKMTKNNIKQAMFPAIAEILPNANGTAPGMWLAQGERIIILLPGPPFEMEAMYHKEVVPRLKGLMGHKQDIIKSRVLKLYGIGESSLETLLQPLIESQSNPTIAPLAKETEIHLRLTAKASSVNAASGLLGKMEKEIRNIVGTYIFAADENTMESTIGILLRENDKTIAVAESCTGGLIGHRLTEIPGSSAYFRYGIVSYSNEAKQQILGVPPQLLEQYGAVSGEVAKAMAEGVRKMYSSAAIGLAVTGIAGPDGGSSHKPVGTTYIAISTSKGQHVEKLSLRGPRRIIKKRASQAALDLVRRYLQVYLK
jgi:nicotinamide-nucleotide amidase